MRDFLWPLVDEHDEEVHVVLIGGDTGRELLDERRLAGLGRRHDEAALPATDWRNELDDAHCDILGARASLSGSVGSMLTRSENAVTGFQTDASTPLIRWIARKLHSAGSASIASRRIAHRPLDHQPFVKTGVVDEPGRDEWVTWPVRKLAFGREGIRPRVRRSPGGRRRCALRVCVTVMVREALVSGRLAGLVDAGRRDAVGRQRPEIPSAFMRRYR